MSTTSMYHVFVLDSRSEQSVIYQYFLEGFTPLSLFPMNDTKKTIFMITSLSRVL